MEGFVSLVGSLIRLNNINSCLLLLHLGVFKSAKCFNFNTP